MVLVTINLHATCDFEHLTIHTNVQIALTAHRLEELPIVTFTAAHQGSEDIDGLAGIIAHDHVEHFLLGIFHHLLASGIAVGLTGTGKEQSHIVIDLGGGANGGAWVLISGLLLDTDHR